MTYARGYAFRSVGEGLSNIGQMIVDQRRDDGDSDQGDGPDWKSVFGV